MIRSVLLFFIATLALSVLFVSPFSKENNRTVLQEETYQDEQVSAGENKEHAADIRSFPFVPVPEQKKENPIEEVIAPIADEHTVASAEHIPFGVETETEVTRPPSLYSFPPVPFEEINVLARESLVNILCTTNTASVSPISASGVLVHYSGIILTNAHVGQYLLLEQDPRIAISCEIRTESPAKSAYKAELVYLPPQWVNEHAHQISELRPLGTGEHDWAILRITNTIDGNPLPTAFPFLSPETREAAGFTEDPVLLASYPAGFIDGNTVQYNLYAASTITTIKKLYTFLDGSVDLLSLGGVIVAQGGSSGGAVINAWNHLIGVIVTSSDAETTSGRDLRAITLAHIDRSIKGQIGIGLIEFLSSDLRSKAADFRENIAPALIEQFIPFLQQT